MVTQTSYRTLTFDEMVALHAIGVRGFMFKSKYGGPWKLSVHNETCTDTVKRCRPLDGLSFYRIEEE